MANRDGRDVARANELRVLKALHKHGWLRTRDLAALLWSKTGAKRSQGFVPQPIVVTSSALCMAQRTLARLRRDRKVIHIQAPDGSLIYGLSEAGARQLVGLGIPAKSGKDQLRRISLSHYHHRRLANETAIVATLQGYRVVSEAEIAAGLWFAGTDGIKGKRPDVVIREGNSVWLVEVERSRRNQKDYGKLLNWLTGLWPSDGRSREAWDLPGGYVLKQIVFVCESAFTHRLIADLRKRGWGDTQISSRILITQLLYVSEAKFVLKEPKPNHGTAKKFAG